MGPTMKTHVVCGQKLYNLALDSRDISPFIGDIVDEDGEFLYELNDYFVLNYPEHSITQRLGDARIYGPYDYEEARMMKSEIENRKQCYGI